MADVQACCICGEDFNTGDEPEQPQTLPCKHTFGSACIQRWLQPLQGTRSCPLCRTNPADFWDSGTFKQRGPMSGMETTTWSFEGTTDTNQQVPVIYYGIDGVMTKDARAALLLMWKGLLASETLKDASRKIVYNPFFWMADTIDDIQRRLNNICDPCSSQPVRVPAAFRILNRVAEAWYDNELKPLTQGRGSPMLDSDTIRLALTIAALKKPQMNLEYKGRLYLSCLLIEGTEAIARSEDLQRPKDVLFHALNGCFPELQTYLFQSLTNSEKRGLAPASHQYNFSKAFENDVNRTTIDVCGSKAAWVLPAGVQDALTEMARKAYSTLQNPTTPASTSVPLFQTAGLDIKKPKPEAKEDPELERTRRRLVGRALNDIRDLQFSLHEDVDNQSRKVEAIRGTMEGMAQSSSV